MIKAAEDAYLAGRQAAMEKLASDGSNTALNLAALAAIPAGVHLGSKYNPNTLRRFNLAAINLRSAKDTLEHNPYWIKRYTEGINQGYIPADSKDLSKLKTQLAQAKESLPHLESRHRNSWKAHKGKGFMDILRRNKGTAIGLGLGTALAGGLYLAGRPDEPDPQEPVVKVGPSAFYTSPSHSAGYRLVSKYGPAQVIRNQEIQRR